jgi:hypothetical protein
MLEVRDNMSKTYGFTVASKAIFDYSRWGIMYLATASLAVPFPTAEK